MMPVMHSSRKTDWRLRLLGISLAGGLVGGALACSSSTDAQSPTTAGDAGGDARGDVTVDNSDSGTLACNANPDPCCEIQGKPQNPAACALKDGGGDAADGSAIDASDGGTD